MKDNPSQENPATPGRCCVVLGAGPAGLTAALELTRQGYKPLVLERDSVVGGISRTSNYKGFYFDLGGHRFYTKSPQINRLWHEVLGEDFLTRPRLSRIYYQRRFFSYPPQLWNSLKGLGFRESVRIISSYLWRQVFPYRNPATFEQWVTNAFGRRLFEIFFKSYTEKVWGMSCKELRAEWAAQRIKGLSLKVVLQNFVHNSRQKVTTLIEEFNYPRRGPGMMWETFRRRIEDQGGEVRHDASVTALERNGDRITAVRVSDSFGQETRIVGDTFISSIPITELVNRMDPPAPDEVLAASANLKYRSFLTVCLILDQEKLFPDNWIYVHEPGVQVARIQNFKNWSEDMVPDPTKTSLGLEYFCDEGDDTWNTPDQELIALGARELQAIGLIEAERVVDGCVFRVGKAYPVYDSTYVDALARVRTFCSGFTNLATVGRNGLHRYNNQDHSMLTGILAARNLVLGENNDIWSVNTSQEYLEEIRQDEGTVDNSNFKEAAS